MTVLLKVLLLPLTASLCQTTTMVPDTSQGPQYCNSYNRFQCLQSEAVCSKRLECSPPLPGRLNHCYVLWEHNEMIKGPLVRRKGCLSTTELCSKKSQCIRDDDPTINPMFFYCCEEDMCNDDPSILQFPPEPKCEKQVVEEDRFFLNKDTDPRRFLTVVLAVALLASTAMVVIVGKYSKKKLKALREAEAAAERRSQQNLAMVQLDSIKLLEVCQRGTYGVVWTAEFNNATVAVKVYPMEHREVWQAELNFLRLPHRNRENILHFIDTQTKNTTLSEEYWLVTAYYKKRSLYDYLKDNEISWEEICTIANSMVGALSYLHKEFPAEGVMGCKPVVAHRDFKSKNVLLRANLTTCIADYSLALIFPPGQPCPEVETQVAACRYMSPEILGETMPLTSEAFLRADMYACGLVLWEAVSRCTAQVGPVEPYKLPFEEQVGLQPTVENMQEIVLNRQERPPIPQAWRDHPGLSVICDLMEQCWSQDAEARPSAACARDKVAELFQCPIIEVTRL